MANLNDCVNVGDIFYSSWGYEQTNISYYQIIKKAGKQSVVLRELDYKNYYGEDGNQYRRPLIGQYRDSGDIKRRVNISGERVFIKIESFEYAYKWDNKDKRYTDYY